MSTSEHVLSIPDLIAKKRDGLELNPSEIQQFITGLSNGDVQDCHVGAMLMAIYIQGKYMIQVSFCHFFTTTRYDGEGNLFDDHVHA